VVVLLFSDGGAGGFDVFFDGDIATGDFAGANFGFGGGFNFERDFFNFNLVVFEGSSDKVVITVAELFDIESVFDADFDIAIFSGDEGGILEPSGKVGGGKLLFYLSKCVFPNVVHFRIDLLFRYYSM